MKNFIKWMYKNNVNYNENIFSCGGGAYHDGFYYDVVEIPHDQNMIMWGDIMKYLRKHEKNLHYDIMGGYGSFELVIYSNCDYIAKKEFCNVYQSKIENFNNWIHHFYSMYPGCKVSA